MKNQITNLITKIISILVIMLMMVNSSLMLVISVAVDAVQKIIDETKINAVYELNMEKYVNYKMGDKQGTLVQTYLKTGIEYQEGQEYVPIDTSNVIINTPKINDKYPEIVEVVTKSTKATNGDGSGKDVNYAYNKENGQLQINTENKADDKGNIYTENVAGARDEYQLDFYYDADCYNDKNEKRSLEFKGNVELKLKDDRDIRKNQEISQNFEVVENVSGLVSADVTTSDIYNGYINANIQNNSTYRTQYTENVKIQTSYKEIADEITVNSKNLLVNNKDKENETQEIIYKNTKVNKNEILDKLGQDGYFKIIDKDGNILATINKDTEADENGNIQIGYDGEKTELNFKFSKPLKLGDINILNTKEIKDTMKDEDVTKVETRNTVSCVNNVTEKTKVIDEETKEEKEVENTKQVEIYNYVGTSVAEIKEAKTDVKVTANNTNWTNNVQNDVTFTATLVTSGPEYNLFKNPVIDIKLPNEVEKVVLGESSILYDSGLQLGSVQVVDDNGSKVIRVKVNGTQTSYVQNEVVNGANIVIPASIILKKDIASSQENIAVSFANYRNAKIPGTGNGNIQVNVESIVNNDVTNDQDSAVANGDTNSTNSNGGSTGNQSAQNTATPVVEAKPIDLDKISVEYKAYLGDNELADGDSVHEGEYIKYVATVTNNTGDDVKNLNVVASVPEGTTYVTVETRASTSEEKEREEYDECKINENSYQKEYSSNISLKNEEKKEIYFYVKAKTLTDENESMNLLSSVKLNDGTNNKEYSTLSNVLKRAELTVSLTGWETWIRTGGIWMYTINVQNNTNNVFSNINVNIDTKGRFTLSKKDTLDNAEQSGDIVTIPIETLGTKQTIEKTVYFSVKTICQKENDQIGLFACVNVNDNKYYSNPNIQNIKNPVLKITQTSEKEGEALKYGDIIEYDFTIRNESELPVDTMFSFRFVDWMDNNMSPISAEYYTYVFDETSEYITSKIEKIDLDLSVKDVPEGKEYDDVEDMNVSMFIPNGKSVTVKIKATPKSVIEKQETSNYGVISYQYNGENCSFKSNVIKNTILPYGYVEPDPDKPDPDTPDPDNPDPDNPDPDNPNPDKPDPDNPNSEKYSISGLVWKDENKNGIREDSEMLLSGVTVKLFNINTNEIVVIDDNKQIATTNQSGEYTFSGLGKGNYIVLFEYDTNKYKLTTYKSGTASENTNSDVINKSVNIDGNEKEVGVTDTINVSTQNYTHIDMGLVENGTYDLSLNKYITNVELTYGTQNQTYSYDNSKLAKVEVPEKKVDNAKVTIEYKIEVKNEGNVDAIVESIVDYKPDGFEFDKSLNDGWNIDNENNLTNISMLGSKLEPGKTRSVTLYLTKTLSKDFMGTFTNSAEILKSSNLLNLKDIDSTEGNKDKTEDDYSEAQIVISVKTGVGLYVGIILIMILLVVIIFLLKLKKIKFNRVKILSMFFTIFIVNMVFVNISNADQWFYYSLESRLWEEDPTDSFTGDYVNYTYHYTHHGHNKKNGVFYCSTGGYMGVVESDSGYTMQNHPNTWRYKYDSGTSNTVSTENYSNKPSISENNLSNKAKNVTSDGQYIYVGPFKITYDSSLAKAQILGTKADGGEVTISNAKFCNSNHVEGAVSSNTEFYVKIPISENIRTLTKLRFAAKKNATKTVTTSTDSKEEWVGTETYSSKQQTMGKETTSKSITTTHPELTTNDMEVTANVSLVGNIKITKCDTDNPSTKLSGATFEITGPNNYSETKTTNEKGTITISNLPLGNYTVTETGAPADYRLNLQENKSTTVNVTSGGTATAAFKNKQYGDLTVTKKDQDTGSTSLGGEPLNDIGFKIYIQKNGKKYYLRNAEISKYSYNDFNVEEWNKGSAKEFKTSGNAQFKINNLPVWNGSEQLTYYVEESSLPEKWQEYYKLKATPDSTQIINGKNTDLSVLNKQIYIQVSGYVWEDMPATEGKEELRNDLYDADRKEPLIEGITVRLNSVTNLVYPYGTGDVNNDGVINKTDAEIVAAHVSGKEELSGEKFVKADINGDGVVDLKDASLMVKVLQYGEIRSKNSGIIQTTKTDKNGNYKFKKVEIDKLPNTYIEFEYNGLKYQSVAYHNQDNGSKAIEGDTTRDNFNNQYASITGGNAKGTTTTGYSRNATGTVMNNLTYTNGKYASELVGNTGYTVESAANSVKAQNGSTGASIKATTSAANHSLATWSEGVVKLENINLGIYKRQQSDMKIATDLKDIGLTFNGYNHTYTYNKRTAKQGIDIFSELQKWNKTDEQKVNENDQYPRKYETSIYKNYAYASASEGDKNGNGKIDDKYKLKMYLNYKIEIKNSSSVYMSANEIARYYNNILTYSSSYYIDKNGNKHDITWNEKADANGYKQIRTTGLSNVKIEPGSSLTVYLTLQIKDDIIKEFGLGSRIDAICQGVTEITSYSNYTSDGKYYAAIDKNSAPDNIKLGDINTYEDDTDSAPELKITLKEPKTITGYVFEDKTSDDLLTNQERKGNGKFDNGENTVGNVKVELIEQTKGKEAYVYPKAVSELNFNAVPATYTTKANGYYEFVGVVPGKYYIKYTYSNGSVVYKGTNEVSTQDYKSTIISPKILRDAYGDTEADDLGSVNNNDRWYQDTNIETYSTAVDDYATRKGINNTYSTIIASKKVDYDKGVGQQEMTARTLNMNMAIENYNNEVTNMNENRTSLYKNLDFGIVIRPRQSLKLDKKVTYVKLTLSGGDTVAEGNPSNENELKTMNYVTYPKGGKLKIEADDEIIQGATLEIKYTIYVTNNSEKDYNNVAYYRYGTKKDNPVKLSINTIVDYIDQKVPTEYTNVAKSSGGWYVSTDQQIKDLTTKAAYNDVKSRKNILLSDCNKTISIGETMATEPVEASKVMASSEDVDIKNYAEAVKVSNSVGRFYGGIVNDKWVNMTPGNLQVSSDTAIEKSSELDDNGDSNSAEVVVVPSTGDNTIIYYILGITCLGIIVCGIVLIKKLVL